MASEILVNADLDKGLLPDSIKPLPEPIIIMILSQSPKGNSAVNTHETNHCNAFENHTFKIKTTQGIVS